MYHFFNYSNSFISNTYSATRKILYPYPYRTIFDQLSVHERMLESYVIAREKFLKPGGLMFPTTGSIVLAPLSDEVLYNEQLGMCAVLCV